MPSNEYDGGRLFGSIGVAEICRVTGFQYQHHPRHGVRNACT
jgi:hypothetical protein